MKMQALALGAALGFLAAITPSCGMQTCSTANCDGCCQGTMCVKRPDNALNSTCGTSGNACVNCAASNTTCDATTFTCATGAAGGGTAGGGTGGGTAGGGTTCDGCRLANGTCQPRNTNRQNNNICGSNGDMCRSCVGTATPVCDNGACIAPPKKVGDQCMQDSECQASLGTMAVCKRGTSVAGNFSYPGGHCTVENCGSQGTDDCPMDSTCLALTGIFGEENTSCFANCTMPANCRTGWSCINIGSMAMPRGVCLPSEFASMDFQLDVGGVVGNPCANSAACRAPTPNAPGAGGFCVPEARQFPDGGIAPGRDGGPQFTSFVGGYCSRECRRDADCDPNGDDNDRVAICIGTDPTCLKSCLEPNLGQSTCRQGYVCEPLSLRDGGLYDVGICDPRCDNPGAGECPRIDGGPGVCDTNTGYCLIPNRIIPVRAGDPCTGPATRCLGDTTCTGLPGGPTTCRATCMTNAQCAPTQECVPGQFNLSVCEPRAVDGGIDGGTAADAGTVTDAGMATDAGTTADAGSTTCPDGGAVGADGGC